jgi:hypothetical protein
MSEIFEFISKFQVFHINGKYNNNDNNKVADEIIPVTGRGGP